MNGFFLLLKNLEDFAFFLKDTLKGFFRGTAYKKDIYRELYLIGAQAFLLVATGGLFIGIILAIEAGHHLETFGAKTLIGRTIALGMIRELGPIITGLLLAARTGAKNTSELGAMQLSEQIDALRAFGTNPIDRLVVPRTLAALVMFLPLTLIADATGIFGGMIISQLNFNIDISYFWNSAIRSLLLKDLFVGFSKPFFFSFFITTISCYLGINTKGGTAGLGKSTINAVVYSSIAVLIVDFIFTKVVWELL